MDAKHGVKVLEKIGSGGFGNVHKCSYKGNICVVKKVPINTNWSDNLKTVKSELEVFSKVRHPRIVRIFYFYQTDVDWNFVLENMQKGSLRSMIVSYQNNSRKFGEDDLLCLFMDIVFGVKYLHSKGIIHRDLKPDNILIDDTNRLKIADFGISKLTDPSAGYHSVIGTKIYMAPEVVLKMRYDKTVDVWAMGIILYEMAMMKYPFSQNDLGRILDFKHAFTYPEIDCARRNYDPDIQRILTKMLRRDPKKRVDLKDLCKRPIVQDIAAYLKNEELKFRG